jgi:chemotaxis protein methyltransferase CheR
VTLSTTDFEFVRRLVLERAAISIDESKTYLVETRLKPLMRESGMSSVGELISALRTAQRSALLDQVVDAMTTNETSWMRDVHPFEVLIGEVIPTMAESGGPIQIWSAACSSGQEPYGLAMLIADRLPALKGRVRILATDISLEMIEKARSGSYTQLEVNRGLAAPLLMKNFERRGSEWVIKPEIRSMVEFRQQNLDRPFVGIPPAHIVLVRNVLIYFDLAVKQAILDKVRRVLLPNGVLVLGASETTVGLDASWSREFVGKTCLYRPQR